MPPKKVVHKAGEYLLNEVTEAVKDHSYAN